MQIHERRGKLILLTEPINIKNLKKNTVQYEKIGFFLCDCGRVVRKNVNTVHRNIKAKCGNCSLSLTQNDYIFGKLKIIKQINSSMVICCCECGIQVKILRKSLLVKKTKQCTQCAIKKIRHDLKGKRFGRLTVINYHSSNGQYCKWTCKCDCGNYRFIKSYSLTSGVSKSCGCLHREIIRARKGINHPNYKPYLTEQDRTHRDNDCLEAEWSKKIKQMAGWTCQKCKIKKRYMVSHHIASYTRYPELRYNLNNGICLCENCHKSFHKKYGNRKFNHLDTFEFLFT